MTAESGDASRKRSATRGGEKEVVLLVDDDEEVSMTEVVCVAY